MEQYIVSARKYRPSTFASVVGQKALTSTLKNAVTTKRLASSYLFCGSRGVGKTTCARIFAKAINCEHLTADGEPCNECASCRDFNNNTSLNIIEMDAASNNGVDAIRQLIDQVMVPPSSGRYRVFIIDEVHMLSAAAFNAFLKTLEEPPSYVVFVLATTEKQKIIPTILSRCQIYDFHRITIADMVAHLQYVASQEGIDAEASALNLIAQKADGAMRDALSIFDQIAASQQGHITYEATLENLNMLDARYYSKLLDAFLEGRVLDTWMIYKEIRDRGFDSLFFINGLGDYFRNILAASTPQTLALVEANPEVQKSLASDAKRCTPYFLLKAMALCNDADLQYRTSSGKQFLIELTLAKICQLLSPSPDDGGEGEGHLKPVAAATAPEAAPGAALPPVPAPRPQQPAAAPQQARQQPAHAAASAHAPAPEHTRTSAPRFHGQIRTSGFSISGGTGQQEASTLRESSPSAPALRSTPFTAESLVDAWRSFITSHPTEHIIVNVMQSCSPTLPDPSAGRVDVKVFSEPQKVVLENSRAMIERYLRDRLANDALTLSLCVSEDAQPVYTLNDREFLASLVDENPILKSFIEEFKLKLS